MNATSKLQKLKINLAKRIADREKIDRSIARIESQIRECELIRENSDYVPQSSKSSEKKETKKENSKVSAKTFKEETKNMEFEKKNEETSKNSVKSKVYDALFGEVEE